MKCQRDYSPVYHHMESKENEQPKKFDSFSVCQIRIDIKTFNLDSKERDVFLLLCKKDV